MDSEETPRTPTVESSAVLDMGVIEGRVSRGRGVVLRAHKRSSTSAPLESAPLPNEIVLPLESGLSAQSIRPEVRSGQRVLRGQPLVSGGGPLATWTHASTSGVIRSLETHPVGEARRRQALCAMLEVDGDDEPWSGLEPPDLSQWDTPDALAMAMSRAGLAGLGGAVFPAGVKLAATWRRATRLVVINGVECEPYISCDDMLMRTSPREVIAGALVLVELTGAEAGVVAIEADKPEAHEALEREIGALGAADRLSLVVVPVVYPAGGERQLIEILTGNQVPSLVRPTDIGYLCQNVGTAVALCRFLQTGEPLISRITTVTGTGVLRQRNLEVRFGTRVADVVTACGGYNAPVVKLIMGGSMMGIPLESDVVPVTRSTNCIVAATEQELPEAEDVQPCIRCGDCAAVCPAYLQPQELFRLAGQDRSSSLDQFGLFDCIECGCCDVVCPSHIPLTESFRTEKQRFVKALSFEARKQWIDSREELRRERIQRWETTHGTRVVAGNEQQAIQHRLAAVTDVIARLNRLPEPVEA